MRIGLLQEQQNKLYDFASEKRSFCFEEAKTLQEEMIEQNFALMDTAHTKNCDLLVTSEAINFCGQPWEVDLNWEHLVPEMKSEIFQKLSQKARQTHTYLAVGVINKRRVHGAFQFYNSAFLYNRQGRLLSVYDKVHLAGRENKYLTPGEKYMVFDSEFGKFGVCICWDMQFPEVCRELALMGAQLVVCPTWGWEQIYGHARAYENGIFVASAMAVPYAEPICRLRNPSEVVSPIGEVLARASDERSQLLTCDLNLAECEEIRAMRLSGRKPATYCHLSEELTGKKE